MRLVELEVQNLFQYRRRVCQFAPGLNAIVGPNGSGKSNLLRCVRWCLTGDLEVAGRNQDAINQFAGEGRKSGAAWSRLTVEPGPGSPAEVTRWLRPPGRSLSAGGRTLDREAEIAPVLESWFGLPLDVVARYIFVGQGELTSFLRDSPRERATSLQRLFRLDQAERCWKALHDFLAAPGKSAPDVAQAELRVRELEVQLGGVERRLRKPPSITAEVVACARVLVGLAAERRALEQRLSETRLRHREAESGAAEASTLVSSLEAELLSLRDGLAVLDPVALSQAAQAWSLRDKATHEITSLRVRLEAIGRDDAEDIHPVPPSRLWSNDDTDVLAEAGAALARERAFLATFDPETGVACCPTCGTDAASLSDRLTDSQARIPGLEALVDELTACRADTQAYERQLREHESRLRRRELERSRALARLCQLESSLPAEPATAASVVSERRREVAALEARVSEAERRLRQARADAERLAGRVEELARSESDLLGELGGLTGTTPPWCNDEAPADLLARAEAEDRERARLEGEAAALGRALASSRSDLEVYRQEATRHEKLQSWRESLTPLRDAMHRDAVPRRVLHSRLAALESETNPVLASLGADFMVSAAEDLSFRARFLDGRDVPAEALSGGQQAVLGIAWRLAVNASMAHEVGLLCLDEPTAGLDADRLVCLRDALEHLRPVCGARGLQVVVVTHDRTLLEAFDRVIDLTP